MKTDMNYDELQTLDNFQTCRDEFNDLLKKNGNDYALTKIILCEMHGFDATKLKINYIFDKLFRNKSQHGDT